MAKKLTALSNEMTSINNSGTEELSVMIPLSSIQLDDDFKDLFPLSQEKIDAITNSIKENGYDKSQPIHVWNCNGKNILIDGHTRMEAAKEAGLYDIPVFKHSFESNTEAQLYALSLQIDRRNLTSAEILIAVQVYDSIKKTGRKPTGSTEETGKSSKIVADKIGVSPRTVEMARKINKSNDEEIINKVKNHELSVSNAYSKLPEVQKRKGSKKSKKEEVIKDTLSDNTGNPSGLNFTHSDGNERPYIPPTAEDPNNVADRIVIARREAHEEGKKIGYEEGLKQGSEIAFLLFQFAIAEVQKGRSPKEVFNDERVADFSPSIIKNFELPEEDEEIITSL